ncbi:hypothetical protein TRICHSKD4_4726 [Roseibium sp. TrichSKD4]|nr:hypothetical protein TRICHSKD4_4726 [Roseibium sp. TrichSKD4]
MAAIFVDDENRSFNVIPDQLNACKATIWNPDIIHAKRGKGRLLSLLHS